MAKSLNKAFIKAYTKGKATVKRRVVKAEVAPAQPKQPTTPAAAAAVELSETAALKSAPVSVPPQDQPPANQASQTPKAPQPVATAPAKQVESPKPTPKAANPQPAEPKSVPTQQPVAPQKKKKLAAAKPESDVQQPAAKERIARSSRPAKPAAKKQSRKRSSPLMSRIDTATVRVPPPHFNRARTSRAPASAAAQPQQNVNRAAANTPPGAHVAPIFPPENSWPAPDAGLSQPQPNQAGTSGVPAPSNAFREMLKGPASTVGTTEDFRIDAIAPGYPAPPEPTAPEEVQAVRGTGGGQDRTPEDQSQIRTNETEALPAHHPGVTGPIPNAKSDPDAPVGNRKDKPHAGSTGAENLVVDDDEEVADKQTLRELQPPESPALSEAPATPETSDRKLTFDEVEKAVRELAKERGKSGEIFRLDRPSYSMSQGQSGPAEAEELSDAFSETDYSDTQSHENIQNAGFLSKTRMTRAMEEGLRQARARVFNPVWEVDNFQWPDVCGELLEAGHDNMQKVASNLSTACQEGLQVLAVTSPGSGAGTTTVSCCLAMLAGMNGMKVAILDGDIENPTLSVQTNLDVESDWKNAILGHMSLEEVAVHSIDDQVTLLPLIQPIDQAEMSTNDDRIYHMMQELSESFDLVIVDTGHIERTRSLLTSMGEQGIISAVVTVVDKRRTSQQAVEDCIRRIRNTGVASIGLVENFAA